MSTILYIFDVSKQKVMNKTFNQFLIFDLGIDIQSIGQKVENIFKSKSSKETNAEEVYRLLREVPEKKWMTPTAMNWDDMNFIHTNGKNKCDAYGHYLRLTSDNSNDYSTKNCSHKKGEKCYVHTASLKFFEENFPQYKGKNYSVFTAYYTLPEYPQCTPKLRCLAVIKDMIKAGY